ncbi:MAG: pilus assembly protein [Pseudomonadota bacterium]
MRGFAQKAGLLTRRFRRDEAGTVSIEAILVIPLLFWAYMAIFVMFDAYKKQTDGLRATYAVADAISREDAEINQTYLNSMADLLDFLTRSPSQITMRTTIVCFSEDLDAYTVAWSKLTGPNAANLTLFSDANINNIKDKLPVIPEGDQVIVLEMFMDYSPMWDIGLDPKEFQYFSFTRPRFTNQVKWENQPTWICPEVTGT